MKETVIHCPTQKEYNLIINKFIKHNTSTNNKWKTYWPQNETETAISISEGKIDGCAPINFYKNCEDYTDYTFTTAKLILYKPKPKPPKQTLTNLNSVKATLKKQR